jgi:uncharacterized membrane protein YcaP (DUF421 family)
MLDLVDQLLGLSLKSEQLGFGQMAVRAFVMYVVLIVIVRSGKKRFLGRATAFDVILIIILGSIAARAVTGGAPYFPAMLALAVLVLMHWVFSALACRSPTFSNLIKGNATTLVKSGLVNERALRNAHVSMDDLDEDLRDKGISDIADVTEARLERSGKLSVIKAKSP